MSLDRVSQSAGIEIPLVPNDPRATWWASFGKQSRYDIILGKTRFMKYLNKLIKSCQEVVNFSPYYCGMYQRQNELLDKLDNSYIHNDSSDIVEIANDLGIQFDTAGMCVKAVYDNYSSSTGRMSIKAGPKILTMHKANRHIFRSSWGNDGALLEIDYNALEPRVLLQIMGSAADEPDVYSLIGREAKLDNVDRDTLKLMILSNLYGMSRRNFIVKFIDVENCDVAYDSLQNVLGVQEIMAHIKRNLENGKIKNHFGRQLACENESVMLNHFTQSSAVDVACDGFLNLVKENAGLIKPVFLIHDALVVDVHKSDVEKVKLACKNGLYIPSLNTNFPTKIKVFNARKDHQ